MSKARALLSLLALLAIPAPALADDSRGDSVSPEASVRGGIYDKPFMFEVGRTRFGGYADLQYRFEREEGFASESSFVAEQVNLFFFAPLHERIRFTTELEIEEGEKNLK